MARPKGKLIALLAIFAAIGLVTASGAFTSVSAQRTAEVDVAGDSSALLGLSENSSNGVTSGVVSKSGGDVELNFNDGSGSASGINVNSTTKFRYVLDVTNNGQSPTDISITLTDDTSDDSSGTYSDTSAEPVNTLVNVTAEKPGSNPTYNLEEGNSVTVSSGNTITLTFVFDTTTDSESIKGDDIIDQISIEAN